MNTSIISKRKKINSEAFAGLLFVLPTIIIFLVFLYYPFFNGVRISFFEYTGIGDLGNFVGFGHYAEIFSDTRFRRSVINTLVVIVVNIIVIYPVSFILAYTLYIGIPFSRVFQFLLFIPYVLSTVVVGTLWSIIFDPTIGPLNSILIALGLEEFAVAWLGNKDTSLYAVTLVGTWKSIPFYMLILYANLLKIPKDLLEAAEIDGAGYFQKIGYVVIPCMYSTFNAMLILIITGSFRFFDLIWVMTMGGPGGASEVTTTYIYRRAFQNNDFGYATAVSMVVIIIVMGLLLINNFIIQRRFKKYA